MNRITHFLVGPETLWVIYYFILVIIIKATHAPIKSMDGFWLSLAYIIPLILLPLTYLLYYAPGVTHSWLWVRLLIVGLIGCHFVLNKALMAHSEQGPGVGTVYIMGMGFAIIVLIAGTIWAVIKF